VLSRAFDAVVDENVSCLEQMNRPHVSHAGWAAPVPVVLADREGLR
jgi:hypothetical protein